MASAVSSRSGCLRGPKSGLESPNTSSHHQRHQQPPPFDLYHHSDNDQEDDDTKKKKVEEIYTSLIQQYLSLFLLDNAVFYAEKLVAMSPTNHNALYLLGLCYHRQGKPQRTKWLLQHYHPSSTSNIRSSSSAFQSSSQSQPPQTSPELLYLLAQASYELQDYGIAEEALLRNVRLDFHKTESNDINQYILTTSPCPIPHGAAGLHLLAKVCAKSNRKQRAIQYYKMSLQLDPFLWSSLEALANLGVQDVDPTQIFGVQVPEQQENIHASTTTTTTSMMMQSQVFTPAPPNYSMTSTTTTEQDAPPSGILQPSMIQTPASALRQMSLFGAPPSSTKSRAIGGTGPSTGGLLFETPNLTPIATEQSFAPLQQQHTTNRAVQRARKVAFREYYEPSPETSMSFHHDKPRSLFYSGLYADESMDEHDITTGAGAAGDTHTKMLLFSEQKSTTSYNNTSSFAKPISSFLTSRLTHHTPPPPQPAAPPAAPPAMTPTLLMDPQNQSVHSILQLLCLLGTAQLHLGQFRSKMALSLYQQLDDCMYHTGWVLHQVGRAYFAMADYPNAIRTLQVMEQLEPHRMAGLEVLSTALWQTKREVELSHLAQRVVELDRLSAEVWCVVGNCFSLQKEHETALVFFRRSIQIDPSFTYSHTLSGHEYFSNEDFDKAVACYRDAIRADDRHYNAWYGLGAVYYRQEKFDLAQYHFHRACSINPQSSVLICHLGMALNANGKPYEALDTLQTAFRLDPQNPQAHYQRALVYQSLDRYEEALVELERVRDAAPREAQIHFSMGRLYKKMGRTDRAMRCFLDALDLDPKDTNLIKAAMEKMDDPDMEEEISAF